MQTKWYPYEVECSIESKSSTFSKIYSINFYKKKIADCRHKNRDTLLIYDVCYYVFFENSRMSIIQSKEFCEKKNFSLAAFETFNKLFIFQFLYLYITFTERNVFPFTFFFANRKKNNLIIFLFLKKKSF